MVGVFILALIYFAGVVFLLAKDRWPEWWVDGWGGRTAARSSVSRDRSRPPPIEKRRNKWRMLALTRRPASARPDCWHVFYDRDIHVGSIGIQPGLPVHADQWRWDVGFYPGRQWRPVPLWLCGKLRTGTRRLRGCMAGLLAAMHGRRLRRASPSEHLDYLEIRHA
jgi:hypothetical protein